MPIPFAINGVGRIGRALVRIACQRRALELVAVNDLGTADQLARLLAHDSLHGQFPGEVSAEGDNIVIDGHRVAAYQESELERIPWEKQRPRIVVDSTGHCLTREAATAHLRGPVEKVLVSANAEGMDLTLCLGVNDQKYEADRHHLLSAASCTTNCLVPVLWVLDRSYTLSRGMLNTVHSYNNDQRLLSFPHRDPRRARAAAINMIPTTTSATEAAVRVLPELEGKIEGFAVRVPTPNVSLIDLVAELEGEPSIEELNEVFRRAAAGELAGILGVCEDELVSLDFLRDTRSAIVDLPLTQAVERRLYRIVAWYDNEWGHASRLADLLEMISKTL